MKFQSESMDRLFRSILALESVEECYEYFSDLCTIKELQDMAQRLDTAVLLSEGASSQEITQKVGMSTATIGRVSRALNYGSGGYRKVIQRLNEEEEA